MGEFAAKFRPEVDLDEFERRLRAAAPPPQRPGNGDPLAELARLVGGDSMAKRQDPFEALFRERATATEGAPREASPQESAPGPEGFYGSREPYFDDQRHGGAHAHPQEAEQFAAESTSYQDAEPAWAPDGHSSAQAQSHEDGWPAAFGESATAGALPHFRRKVMYGMATALVLGVFAIGATLAMRGKSGGSQEVATIQADADPAKIKPAQDSDGSAAQPGQALFDRKGNGNVARVVASSEQPADLGVTVKNARVVGAAAGVATPVPPAPSGAAPAAPQVPTDSVFPPPKKVKTVAVRADGAVIDSSNAPLPVARALPTMAAGAPAPSVSSNAAGASKTPATKLPDRATTTNEAALAPPSRPQGAKEAKAEAGDFAVQLAGAPGEAEARAAANSLSAKYSSALQGHKATFTQAKVGDKTIYRVRVGHLTQDAAKSICAAIKAQGGACFIAKN